MALDESEATARTKRCLERIKSHDKSSAKVIFIFGKEGVGKSSLAEKITQVTGLAGNGAADVPPSGPGTEKCQIIDTEINGTTYFIVDTPGFYDEASQWHIFHDIADTFNQIRGHAVIAAIFFVTPINTFTRRLDELEQRLYAWLTELCGETFFPYLTFVTTFWEGQTKAYNERLEARKRAEWASFLLQGARTYQFGKRHVDGFEMEEVLSWDVDADELSNHARKMVVRHCRNDSSSVEPLFLRELSSGVSLDATSAAKIFRPESSTSNTGTSQKPLTPDNAKPANSRRRGTGNKTEASSTSQPAEGFSLVQNIVRELGRGVGDALMSYVPVIAQNMIAGQLGGGGGGGLVLRRNGGPGAMAAQGFDINSSVDTAKFLGLSSDFESRKRLYTELGGPGIFTGSAANGDWLRDQFWRRAKD
ncbi:hypothetical protein AN3328.2 [Aspergillus nidulans FGSC A4]|uniref:G domain-containing protein n=1 Tax=Emericella nidulans (strain FGSC A4 / ATCC 38163 / CBS 112.46 / NRRL 194 / M139) TaxID=227321 RepID=Q5B802_EMENI|nr:hypothetical protein [Aspergillus nidulans FGSC A4]EAA63296.1 hypothetical protein AN3328.2 [Aspergillus nidulans FGSC A4]CBF82936.1 TPA: conserved hypothetical protein [Aspergillus nidulans FGSC A4]|eukprot:XP_660932.1 hypothetical protein AN3328.2 [Aspergillus nidulans FGSC A4]